MFQIYPGMVIYGWPKRQNMQKEREDAGLSRLYGSWMDAAWDIMLKNYLNLFTKEQNKSNNLLLTGHTNCGKSFLLNPLEDMFICCYYKNVLLSLHLY